MRATSSRDRAWSLTHIHVLRDIRPSWPKRRSYDAFFISAFIAAIVAA